MGQSILTLDMIAREMALQVENNLVFCNSINNAYEKEWDSKPNGYTLGDTVYIRHGALYGSVGTTATAAVNDFEELKTPLTLNYRRNIAVAFTSQERTLDIGEFSDRVIRPKALQLANEIERVCLTQAILNTANTGTAGTTPNSLAYLAAAGRLMDEAATPGQDRHCIWNPAAHWSMAGVLGTVYNETVNKEVLREARITRAYGFDHYMSQVIPAQVSGTVTGGTAKVNGTAQGVVSVTSNAIPDGTIAGSAGTGAPKAGDTFTIAGVYAVNPITKQSTGQLKNFVLATDASFVSGTANLICRPGLVVSGPYQNVTAAPSTNANITFTAGTGGVTIPQSLAYHRDAFTWASAPLYMPESVPASAKSRVRQGKVSIRLVGYYTGLTDIETYRADVLFGFAALNPGMAARIPGAGV